MAHSLSPQSPPNAIKVLHVIHWPNSGITSFLKNFLRHKGDSRFRYHVLFFLCDPVELSAFRTICSFADCLHFDRNRLNSLIRYWRVIRRLSPDIIHTHSFQPGLWGRIFRIGTKARIVSTIHSPYPYFSEKSPLKRIKAFAETLSMNLANSRTICISDAVRQHVEKCTGIRSELLTVIRNGIERQSPGPDPTSLAETRREITSDDSARIIMTIGRLDKEKGLDVLLTAFSNLLKRARGIALAIIGGGPLEKTLKEQAIDLGIEKHVYFLGFKPDVRRYLAVSDLYVSAARYEGLGMSLIEALAAGISVVATRVDGIPEVIEHERTGILVEPDNPEMLADAMLKLLNCESTRNRFRENGLKRVAEHFEISGVVDRYEDLYLRCLAAKE